MIVIENGVAVEAVTKQPIDMPFPLASIASVPQTHDNDNPLWAGPGGEGPLGGITQSMLVRFLSCRERFRLRYVLGLEPHPKWNHRLGYGDMWHVCEEAHAAGTNWWERLQNHCMEVAHGRPPAEGEDITKWMNVCAVQFPEYTRYWADHPDVLNRTPLLQEHVFDVPYALPSGRTIRLRGKFDSVDIIEDVCTSCGGVGDEYGRCGLCNNVRRTKGVYLQENKTKGDIDKLQIERQLRFDLQTMLYLVALDELDDGPDWTELDNYSVRGVRYNVVRRPLSGGVGSIRPHAEKRTKNTYVPAETAEEFYERLRRDYIAADPSHWFFRVRSEVSARDIQVFRDTCLDPLLETVCYWYHEVVGNLDRYGWDRPPMNYRTPFGVYSALEEGGATEYDGFLATGSEVGLRRVDTLFTELQ